MRPCEPVLPGRAPGVSRRVAPGWPPATRQEPVVQPAALAAGEAPDRRPRAPGCALPQALGDHGAPGVRGVWFPGPGASWWSWS